LADVSFCSLLRAPSTGFAAGACAAGFSAIFRSGARSPSAVCGLAGGAARGRGRRYHLCLKHFADIPAWTRANREQQIAEAAQRYARLLEQYARRAPLQWFNFYDFWNTPHG